MESPQKGRAHRRARVAPRHQDAAGAVVDVLEAVGPEQDAAVPARHHHQHVPHVQDLRLSGRERRCDVSADLQRRPDSHGGRTERASETDSPGEGRGQARDPCSTGPSTCKRWAQGCSGDRQVGPSSWRLRPEQLSGRPSPLGQTPNTDLLLNSGQRARGCRGLAGAATSSSARCVPSGEARWPTGLTTPRPIQVVSKPHTRAEDAAATASGESSPSPSERASATPSRMSERARQTTKRARSHPRGRLRKTKYGFADSGNGRRRCIRKTRTAQHERGKAAGKGYPTQ